MADATPPASSSVSSPASPLRGLVLRLVLSVVALHAIAIALFHALGIETAGARTRSSFMIVWVVATLVVCMFYLRRIRLIRKGWAVRRR